MNGSDKLFVVIIVMTLLIIMVISTVRNKEKFEDLPSYATKSDVNALRADYQAVQNISSMFNSGKIIIPNLEINGALTVTGDTSINGNIKSNGDASFSGKLITNGDAIFGGKLSTADDTTFSKNVSITGKITATGGGEFTAPQGSTYYFSDGENAGKLRVGAAWGNPGIFCEDNTKSLMLGSANGWTKTGPGQNMHVQNDFTVDNNLNARHVLTSGDVYVGSTNFVIDGRRSRWAKPAGWCDWVLGTQTC